MVRPNSNETQSLWMSDVTMPQCLDLRDDISAEVCVVGAGLAGLLTAYLLMKSGRKVVVLEESRLGAGQSGRTTAQFSYSLDRRYGDLIDVHGEETMREVARSYKMAIEKTFEIIQNEQIDCEMEFVDGYLFRAVESPTESLEKEFEALQKIGLTEVELRRRGPYSFFHTGPVLHFPKQLQLHPLKYLKGLAQLILLGGGKIYENSPVVKVQAEDPTLVFTQNNSIVTADFVVVATNSPINDLIAIHTKQAPYRSYVIAAEIPKNSVPHALVWDTEDPLHYVRVEANPVDTSSRGITDWAEELNDHLVVGGEDHKTGQSSHPEEAFAKLEQWTRQRFPMAGKIEHRWSGQVMESADGLPFLGKNPGQESVFIITGDSGNGMTSCTVGAMMIEDFINGNTNPWTEIYSPSRHTVRAAGEFIKENANALSYLARRLLPVDEGSYRDMPNDSGLVVTHLGKKIAIYKDPKGESHTYSAVCPHMGCVVSWNAVEKSWDCPCHGSRFDCQGQVIEGPAVSNIKRADWKF